MTSNDVADLQRLNLRFYLPSPQKLPFDPSIKEIRCKSFCLFIASKNAELTWCFIGVFSCERFCRFFVQQSWLTFLCILLAYALILTAFYSLYFQLSNGLRSTCQARLPSDRTRRSAGSCSYLWYHWIPVWSRNDNF